MVVMHYTNGKDYLKLVLVNLRTSIRTIDGGDVTPQAIRAIVNHWAARTGFLATMLQVDGEEGDTHYSKNDKHRDEHVFCLLACALPMRIPNQPRKLSRNSLSHCLLCYCPTALLSHCLLPTADCSSAASPHRSRWMSTA